ncbi:unnamed protein product [Staurois parvus]|uniref:Uncharacterized protein n=1 Tax=Staurois parvus TaxID=386267 RepID=A0ABN9DB37_9NEOB|nr:unnamed protein product [Staurois parvus]
MAFMCTDGHWYMALIGTARWQLWSLTGGTYGATLIIRALMISALRLSLSAWGEDCR